MFFILNGTFNIGLITVANKLVTKGDVFIFPRGLVHFQSSRPFFITTFNGRHSRVERAIGVLEF